MHRPPPHPRPEPRTGGTLNPLWSAHPFWGVGGDYNCDIGGSALTIVGRMERRFSPVGMEFARLSFDVDSKREPTMKTIVRRTLISGFALLIFVPAILFGLGLASLFYMRRRGAA